MVSEKRNAQIRVVAVEPLWESNLGYIARIMKNFGVTDLAVVRPRCNPMGPDAIKFSKHASDVIKSLRKFGSIEAATKGYFAVGTTAIWHKTEHARYNVYSPETAAKISSKNGHIKIAIVLGRDDTGLDKEELSLFPMSVFIESNPDYPTLNISHALAIILYEFTKGKAGKISESVRGDGKELSKQVSIFIDAQKHVREKRAVEETVMRVLARASLSRSETKTLAALFSIKKNSLKTVKHKKDEKS